METPEDRLRRLQREREGVASATWELNPTAPRDTGVASATWEPNAPPSGNAVGTWGPAPGESSASATWTPNADIAALADKIVEDSRRPTFARKNADGTPNYGVPVDPRAGGRRMASHLKDHHDAEVEMGNAPVSSAYDPTVRPSATGESIRRQVKFLDDVHSGRVRVDRPVSEDTARRWAGLSADGYEESKRRLQSPPAKAVAASIPGLDYSRIDVGPKIEGAPDAPAPPPLRLADGTAGRIDDATAKSMIDRIRAARQDGAATGPSMSVLAQQMMFLPDGSPRPVPSEATLAKWAEIDSLAGRKRDGQGHVPVPPARPVAAQARPVAVDSPPEERGVKATPVSLPPPVQAEAVQADAPRDPKAAITPEPTPVPSRLTPQQRALMGRAEWKNLTRKNRSLIPHFRAAAEELGLGALTADSFGRLSPEQVGELRSRAHELANEAQWGQFDDRLSDRNQSREQGIPMALATSQRLMGRGEKLLAEAGGLHDSDPKKEALLSQGNALIAQGERTRSQFMALYDRMAEQQMQQQVARAAMIYGPRGAEIVQQHLAGQQSLQRQQLENDGRREDRIMAEAGLDRRADAAGNVERDVAGMRITAEELKAGRENEQRMKELQAASEERALTRIEGRELKEREMKHDELMKKLDREARAKEGEAQRANNPPQLTPQQQHEQLWGPLQAADANPNDDTPVQQHVDRFVQSLAGQQGLTNEQRTMQASQARAWGNRHVMSRLESGTLRDSDKGYLRSLVYAVGPDGQPTGTLKDRAAFVREMGSHYNGRDWASVSAKLVAYYDALAEQEKSLAGKVPQVGIPDNPIV